MDEQQVVNLDEAAVNGERRYLTVDEILEADDKMYEDVFVERWGGYVRVHALTAAQRDRFEASLVKNVGKGKKQREMRDLTNMRARLVALTATDELNRPLFQKPEQVTKLGTKNASEVDRLFKVAADLSGLTEEDIAELEGNSEEVDGTTSSTDLPAI